MTKHAARAERRRERRAATGATSRSGRGSTVSAAAWVAPVLLILAGVWAYDNGLRGPFLLDDLSSIPGNPSIRQLWPLSGLLSAPPDSTVGPRPVVNFSLAVNYALGGLDVWGYHAFNLAVHIVAALAAANPPSRKITANTMFRTRPRSPWPGWAGRPTSNSVKMT